MPRKLDPVKQAVYKRAHYERNLEAYKRKSVESTRNARARNRAFVDAYLVQQTCVDCGEDDPDVFEFDHVRGIKIGDISTLANKPCTLQQLKDEIEKCVVRCANCHRRKTRKSHAGVAQQAERLPSK